MNITMKIAIKKGIARPGIIGFVSLFASLCVTFPCYALSVSNLLIGDLLISEMHYNPTEVPPPS